MSIGQDSTRAKVFSENLRVHAAEALCYEALHGEIFNQIEQKRLRNELTKLIPTDSVVLDFGSGTGNVTNILLSLRVRKVVSVDISKEMLSIVKRRFPSQVANGRLALIRLSRDDGFFESDNRFDAVILYSVMHHVFDIATLLTNLSSLVTEKGIILIDHERPESYWPRRARFALSSYERIGWRLNKLHQWISRHPGLNLDYRWADCHTTYPTRINWSEVNSILTSRGFVVRTKEYLLHNSFIPNPLYFLLRPNYTDSEVLLAKRGWEES